MSENGPRADVNYNLICQFVIEFRMNCRVECPDGYCRRTLREADRQHARSTISVNLAARRTRNSLPRNGQFWCRQQLALIHGEQIECYRSRTRASASRSGSLGPTVESITLPAAVKARRQKLRASRAKIAYFEAHAIWRDGSDVGVTWGNIDMVRDRQSTHMRPGSLQLRSGAVSSRSRSRQNGRCPTWP